MLIFFSKIVNSHLINMDLEKVFHMNGGVGNSSYARNSSIQKMGSDMVKHITVQEIQQVYLTTRPKSLGIADLGCSSGDNSLSLIREMVCAVEEVATRAHETEFRVFLNDLPANDFNTTFKALPEFYQKLRRGREDGGPHVYVAGYPGSFYGRLFPGECLHFVYSACSLHWLSKVPPGLFDEQGRSKNKGNIYISEFSSPDVSKAYFVQFQEDFSLFLRSLSKELTTGGKMVLMFLGRIGTNHVDRGNSFLFELLSRAFSILVSQGKVPKEKLDSYEVHFYAPSMEEIEDEVTKEGSFEIERLEMFEISRVLEDGMTYGRAVAMAVRAIQESMISHHFGEGVMDDLFMHYGRLVDEEVAREDIRPINFICVMRKII